MKKQKRRFKPLVVLYSIIGLGFVTLAFFIDWLFLIGALVIIWLNQRELMKK